jgi:hypothetical protein
VVPRPRLSMSTCPPTKRCTTDFSGNVKSRVGQLVLGFLWATRNFDFGTPGTFFELITKPQFDFQIFIFFVGCPQFCYKV